MAEYTQKKITAGPAQKAGARTTEIGLEQRGGLEVVGPVLVPTAPHGTENAPDAANALRIAAETIIALSRKSGGHAFDLGRSFAEAKPLVPEKAFGKWLKTFSDYTVRSAWNYISIHENLQDYREQLLRHTVMPTVMFELAKGEPAQIEAVIARMAAGERIRVKDVREAFGRRPKSSSEAAIFDTAGVAGLRKVAAAKIDEDTAEFQKLMTSILKEVEVALEPLGMKRSVRKGQLSKKVHLDCRHAHDLLNSVAAPLVRDVTTYMNWRSARLPKDTVWRKVQDLLHRMGGEDDWAKGDEFVPWLQNEVVPLFRFVVLGETVAAGPDVDNEGDTEKLMSFDQMPSSVKDQVEEALEQIAPENRDDIRSRVFFDPTPSQHQAA